MFKKLKLILLPLFAFSLFVNSSKDTNNIKKASASEEINFVVENKIGKVYENYVIKNMYDKNDDTVCWLDVSLHNESKQENIPGTLEYIFSSPIIIKNIYFNSGKDDGNGLSDFANGTISYKNENDQYIDLFTVNYSNNVKNYLFEENVIAKSIKLTLDLGQEQWLYIKEFNFNTQDKYLYAHELESTNVEIPLVNRDYNLAIDDDFNTFAWFNPTDGTTGNPYFILDLNKPTRFNYISLTMDARPGTDFIPNVGLSYSNDIDFKKCTNVEFTLTRDGNSGRSYAYLKTPVEATYVKAYSTDEYKGWVILNDFSVGYTIELSDALDIYTGGRAGIPFPYVENATDLNNKTYFDVRPKEDNLDIENYYFKYDLGRPTVIDSLLITHGASYGDHFVKAPQLFYSLDDDENSYKPLNTYFNNSSLLFINSSNIEMRYIKVVLTEVQWFTITQFSLNNLYNFRYYLSSLNCDELRNRGNEIIINNDYLYNKLSESDIADLESEEIYKYNYYCSYYQSTVPTSNLINFDYFKDNNYIFSIISICSIVALLSVLVISFKNKRA